MARTIVGTVFGMLVLLAVTSTLSAHAGEDGWVPLFDGETLNGWKASENKDSFSVRNGAIVADGTPSHLFYTGPVENAIFTDFELKADVMTKPGSNGGIYFHTEYQESGWPLKGFEAQVNNTHKNKNRTGSLFQSSGPSRSVNIRSWFTI